MKFLTCLTISIFLFIALLFGHDHAATYTVRAAAVPGGGMRLDRDKPWTINVDAGTTQARIWARTNCNIDGGRCQTGDCNGLLQCQGYGQPPNTLAEYALNQFNNLDFFFDNYCSNSGDCGPTDYSRFLKTRCPDSCTCPKDDQTNTFTCPDGAIYRILNSAPSQLIGRFKEEVKYYEFLFNVPGLGKDDVKVTLEGKRRLGLTIKGELMKKESDAEKYWFATSSGYSDTTTTIVLLPKDTKIEGITADMKNGNGILTVHIQKPEKDVNEIEVK